MKKYIFLFIGLIFSTQIIFSQNDKLLTGPMLGYCTMHEVSIWLQTNGEASVVIKYFTQDKSQVHFTNIVKTTKEEAFTAHLIADSIKPSTTYFYEIYIDGKKVDLPQEKLTFKTKTIWRYRTEPPEFSFACGSGAYINEPEFDRPGKPYGGEYEIYNQIAEKKPDFMLWLGDNIYLRQNEWNSWTGFVHRYTHTRSIPEIRNLLMSTYNYAILDDHDFGPNDSDGSFPFKDMAIKAFKTFWANPSYGLPETKGAITYFNWNDVDFFLLDNRYHRDPNHLKAEHKTQLGKEQLEWLKKALVYSRASFKFVVIGGQFLTSAKRYETYSNYGFDKERQEIIDFIYQQNIKNVIFLTGDRHFSEISVLKKEGKPTIYDITVSPLTSGPSNSGEKDNNIYRVEGSLISKRNFAIIHFSGPYKERKMDIKFYDSKGNLIYEYEIKRER